MLKFDSTGKINFKDECEVSDFFHWLPHSNDIIVIKKVHAVSKVWGLVELDLEKIRNSQFPGLNSFPSDYAIEALAQSIGMIGATQSKLNLLSRGTSTEAYVTGLKDFVFESENISFQGPLYAEIYETRHLENFRFCNVKLYRKSKMKEELLVSGIMKTYTIEKN